VTVTTTVTSNDDDRRGVRTGAEDAPLAGDPA
jgi:hypothetical protein